MGNRYNEQTKRMEYVQDPFSAQLPDVKAAAQYGYNPASFQRGMDGKISSAIDPTTGQRVAFTNGMPPEMVRKAATGTTPQAQLNDTGGGRQQRRRGPGQADACLRGPEPCRRAASNGRYRHEPGRDREDEHGSGGFQQQ